jgi:hypothetical protein
VNFIEHYFRPSLWPGYMITAAHKGSLRPSIPQRQRDENVMVLPFASFADRELNSPPLHLILTDREDGPAAQDLFRSALHYPSSYKRIKWWNLSEGPLPNLDVNYPQLSRAALFVCTNRTCSAPIFHAQDAKTRWIASPPPARSADKKLTIMGHRAAVSSRRAWLRNLTGPWTS